MPALSSIVRRENNNFDLIKLVAAFFVIYGHSFALFPNGGRTDLISGILGFGNSGALAINTFFFLSGLFVTASFIKLNNAISFVLMRFFRLLPALFICIVITVFIAGPVLTSLSIKNYFGNTTTWKYFFHNIAIYKLKYDLRAFSKQTITQIM
jgi:peptidoglycan/LPS O-acetylase OafA/YrhL